MPGTRRRGSAGSGCPTSGEQSRPALSKRTRWGAPAPGIGAAAPPRLSAHPPRLRLPPAPPVPQAR
ncbi:hypothetical protein ABTE32_22765, partial [Acinetobacter baumannii]